MANRKAEKSSRSHGQFNGMFLNEREGKIKNWFIGTYATTMSRTSKTSNKGVTLRFCNFKSTDVHDVHQLSWN